MDDGIRRPDPPFAGASPNARVWHMYGREVTAFDSDTVTGWMDNLDVFLVFVGLFSAVVTSFLVQSAQAFQDPNKINSYLLRELIALQRAAALGISPNEVPPSILGPESMTAHTVDVIINGLWIASLTVSLASALVAALAKQWLHHYISRTPGAQRDRVLLQQYRFIAIEKWHIPFIVGMLPMTLHLAIFLFWAGLAVFFASLHAALFCTVIVLSGATLLFYVVVHILPLFKTDCAYITPFTEHIYPVFCLLREWLYDTLAKLQLRQQDPPIEFTNDTSGKRSLRTEQLAQVKQDIDVLAAHSLIRLHAFSPHPSIPEIITDAIAGLPGSMTALKLIKQSHRLKTDVLAYCNRVLSIKSEETGQNAVAVRLTHTLLHSETTLASDEEDAARVLAAQDKPSIENAIVTLQVLIREQRFPGHSQLNFLLTAVDHVLKFVDHRGLPAFVWVTFANVLHDLSRGSLDIVDGQNKLDFASYGVLCHMIAVIGPDWTPPGEPSNHFSLGQLWDMPHLLPFRDVRSLILPSLSAILRRIMDHRLTHLPDEILHRRYSVLVPPGKRALFDAYRRILLAYGNYAETKGHASLSSTAEGRRAAGGVRAGIHMMMTQLNRILSEARRSILVPHVYEAAELKDFCTALVQILLAFPNQEPFNSSVFKLIATLERKWILHDDTRALITNSNKSVEDDLRCALVHVLLQRAASSAQDTRGKTLHAVVRLSVSSEPRHLHAAIYRELRRHGGLHALRQMLPITFTDGAAPDFDGTIIIIREFLAASAHNLAAVDGDALGWSQSAVITDLANVDTLSWLLWIDGCIYIGTDETANSRDGVIRYIRNLEHKASEELAACPEDLRSTLRQPLPWNDAWRKLAIKFAAHYSTVLGNRGRWHAYIHFELRSYLSFLERRRQAEDESTREYPAQWLPREEMTHNEDSPPSVDVAAGRLLHVLKLHRTREGIEELADSSPDEPRLSRESFAGSESHMSRGTGDQEERETVAVDQPWNASRDTSNPSPLSIGIVSLGSNVEPPADGSQSQAPEETAATASNDAGLQEATAIEEPLPPPPALDTKVASPTGESAAQQGQETGSSAGDALDLGT